MGKFGNSVAVFFLHVRLAHALYSQWDVHIRGLGRWFGQGLMPPVPRAELLASMLPLFSP